MDLYKVVSYGYYITLREGRGFQVGYGSYYFFGFSNEIFYLLIWIGRKGSKMAIFRDK